MAGSKTFETLGGQKVDVDRIRPVEDGKTRFEFDVEDGPRWRIDVKPPDDYELVTSWSADDELADLDLPKWIDDIVAQMQRV